MTDEKADQSFHPDKDFVQQVSAKAARKLRVLKDGSQTVWFGLGMSGLIGWSVAVPTVVGAMIGLWWEMCIRDSMEVAGLLGEMPSRLGYQSTMGTDLSGLEERIANTHAGAITSIQAVYVPADDLTDPAAVHVFSHLSASIVLSRKRASEGLYPAIDLLQSSSKMATPGIVGDRHYNLAQEIRRTLAQYESCLLYTSLRVN